MNPTLIKELLGMVIRYAAPAIVAALAHWMKETDRARLLEILTSEEMLAVYTACVVAFGFAVKSWLAKTRFALTAMAMPNPSTVAEVKETAKTQAPVLSTPAHEVPQLTQPPDGKFPRSLK